MSTGWMADSTSLAFCGENPLFRSDFALCPSISSVSQGSPKRRSGRNSRLFMRSYTTSFLPSTSTENPL